MILNHRFFVPSCIRMQRGFETPRELDGRPLQNSRLDDWVDCSLSGDLPITFQCSRCSLDEGISFGSSLEGTSQRVQLYSQSPHFLENPIPTGEAF